MLVKRLLTIVILFLLSHAANAVCSTSPNYTSNTVYTWTIDLGSQKTFLTDDNSWNVVSDSSFIYEWDISNYESYRTHGIVYTSPPITIYCRLDSGFLGGQYLPSVYSVFKTGAYALIDLPLERSGRISAQYSVNDITVVKVISTAQVDYLYDYYSRPALGDDFIFPMYNPFYDQPYPSRYARIGAPCKTRPYYAYLDCSAGLLTIQLQAKLSYGVGGLDSDVAYVFLKNPNAMSAKTGTETTVKTLGVQLSRTDAYENWQEGNVTINIYAPASTVYRCSSKPLVSVISDEGDNTVRFGEVLDRDLRRGLVVSKNFSIAVRQGSACFNSYKLKGFFVPQSGILTPSLEQPTVARLTNDGVNGNGLQIQIYNQTDQRQEDLSGNSAAAPVFAYTNPDTNSFITKVYRADLSYDPSARRLEIAPFEASMIYFIETY